MTYSAPPQRRSPDTTYGAPPAPRRQLVVARESASMMWLRATTYVLCSLAALTFLVLVVYGYLQLQALAAAWEQLGAGLGGLGGATPPPSFELPPFPEDPTLGG